MFFNPVTVTIIHLLSISVILAFVIDEDKKSFVRFTDDGLYMATLNAFDNEWQNTFVKGVKGNDRVMKSNSPVNFWFRCVDMQVRGYFFIESLAQHPTPNFNDMVYGPDDMKRRFKLLADDKPLPYESWHSGGDFYIDASGKPATADIVISVEGWVKYTAFPLSECTKSLPQPAEPEYLMHVHTYDHPKSIKLNKLYPSGIAHHLVYHRC
eukprot:gene36077-46898_t